MDIEHYEGAIEALLFAMGKSVSLSAIAKAIGHDTETTRKIIDNMMLSYNTAKRGIKIIELENSYQMCTKEEYYDYLVKLALQPKKASLSDVMLETLSIIAYKQPVTKLEIEKIRGVKCDHAINKLIEYNLIQEVGRLDAPGRPILFGTTEEFLRSFGVQGIEELSELDPVQIRNEAGAAHGKAQPRSCQLAGFREGLHHQQVVVPVNERHAALAAKVHIGLIHNDHIVRVRFQDALDGTAGQGQAGGGVGVCDDDGLVQAVVIGGVKGEILLQRDDMAGDMHQPAPDAVTAVGDVGIGQRVGLIAEGPQGKEKVLVTAVAGHDLIRLQAKVHRRRFQQVGAGGVGVETELFHLVLAHRRHHRRAGQIGAFVGVQLDVLLVLRLLPWGVGGDCFKFRREIFTHSNFLTVSVLALSGASRQLPQRGSLWRFSVTLREIAKASPFGRGGIAKQ